MTSQFWKDNEKSYNHAVKLFEKAKDHVEPLLRYYNSKRTRDFTAHDSDGED